MPVPSSITSLSQTAGSNSPAGSESPALIDDYLRALSAFIAFLRDDKASTTGSYSDPAWIASLSGAKLTAASVAASALAAGAAKSNIGAGGIETNELAASIVSSLVPAGAVIYFGGVSAPSGWLKCNGSAVSRTTYAALFSAIGTTFGAGDGSTTFNLPDLRGEFVRGWDDGRGIDSGRSRGTLQLDAFQGHEHQFYDVSNGGGGGYNGSGSADWTRNTQAIVQKSGYSSPRVADETRPRNVALLACIKY